MSPTPRDDPGVSAGPAFEPVSIVGIERDQHPRRGRLLAALIIGLVVVVFGFATVFLLRYHPFEAASAVSPGRFAERPRRKSPGPLRLRFVPRRGTTVGVLLRNGGQLSVKLQAVEIDGEGAGGILRQTKARLPLVERSRTVALDQTRAFANVGLQPAEAQWVILVLRFGRRCPAGRRATVGALRVRYSVFELHKRMRVPLREGVEVRCPRRGRGRGR